MYSKYILIASFVIAGVFARPSDSPPEKEQPTVIPIVSQSDELESNGTYKFSYETGNGIKREEIAYEKVLPKGREVSSKEKGEDDDESDEIHVQQGSYSYTAPDGTVITLRYIADENGFQPIGNHLPRSPVPSPVLSNSAEKSGRTLKAADSADSASTPIEAKTAKIAVKKPTETVMLADELLKTVTQDSSTSSTDAKKSETKSEGNGPEPANINVSTEVASKAASAQSSTEASPASVEQTSTSAPEQSAESSSSTSAPEQSSSSEVVGQSTTTEAVSQSPAEEVQKTTTNAASPAPVEGSDPTTVSA